MPTLLLCRLRALVEMLQMLEIYAQDTSPTDHCAGHDAIKCARIFLHQMVDVFLREWGIGGPACDALREAAPQVQMFFFASGGLVSAALPATHFAKPHLKCRGKYTTKHAT